jgi:hypothetical protein
MITVEVLKDDKGTCKEVAEIFFDKDGLEDLLARLTLIKDGKADHIHLMSETWGLGDLSETALRPDSLLIHHLQLTFVRASDSNETAR